MGLPPEHDSQNSNDRLRGTPRRPVPASRQRRNVATNNNVNKTIITNENRVKR